MHFTARLIGLFIVIIAGLWGCSESEDTTAPQQKTVKALLPEQKAQLTNYRQAGKQLLQALVACNKQLLELSDAFLARVNSDNKATLQDHLSSCQTLHQASTMLLAFNPIVQQQLLRIHQRLDSSVTLPGYIDATDDYPNSGIVQDTSLKLSKASLRKQHQLYSDEEVCMGYSVIEFLLKQPPMNFEVALFWQDTESAPPIEDHPNNRRRHFFELVTALALEESKDLADLWAKQSVPNDWQAALSWRDQQLSLMIESLEHYPSNDILLQTLYNWRDQGIIPGVPSAPTSDQPLNFMDMHKALTQALNQSNLQ